MDITKHSESELSMWFLNDESLYDAMLACDSQSELEALACGFRYTQEQFDDLIETWEENKC